MPAVSGGGWINRLDLFAVWRDHYHTRRKAKESERRGA